MDVHTGLWTLVLCLFVFHRVTYAAVPCAAINFGHGSIVCECNATYCDTIEPNTRLSRGSYAVYRTTKAGERLRKFTGQFSTLGSSNTIAPAASLLINTSATYQSIIGFGGAFTDAAGINIASLPKAVQDTLMKAYFSPDGLEYTVGRIPMASCDFSTREYSYDDSPGDLHLTNFSLAEEDLKYKIPYIQMAERLSERGLRLFGSPWSAPAWMKTNQKMTGKGSLIGEPGGEYYKAWANYFIRFIQEYQRHNLTLWGLTAQNEPVDGELPGFSFQSMGWTAQQQRDFIAKDLGPALRENGLQDVKLMILDDQRLLVQYWADVILGDEDASQYVSGIGVHWYVDLPGTAFLLSRTHDKYPDKFILATEACAGSMPFPYTKGVVLGSWYRANSYAHDIIQDLRHWVTGWVDWNIALSTDGGPNWAGNRVDSPIIVDEEKRAFYKQPTFYTLGHFSKFVPPGSVRVGVQDTNAAALDFVAFTTPENSTVIIILNRKSNPQNVRIHNEVDSYFDYEVPASSIQTVVCWNS